MNIIELVKSVLQSFPGIAQVCNNIHIDFTNNAATNYGLSPVGDELLSEDVIGNQRRKHNFVLFAVYQSQSDYDRIANSGTLLELQMWLERHATGQQVSVPIGDETITGMLTRLTCANGMLFEIPTDNLNVGVRYQLQITAEYKINA